MQRIKGFLNKEIAVNSTSPVNRLIENYKEY